MREGQLARQKEQKESEQLKRKTAQESLVAESRAKQQAALNQAAKAKSEMRDAMNTFLAASNLSKSSTDSKK